MLRIHLESATAKVTQVNEMSTLATVDANHSEDILTAGETLSPYVQLISVFRMVVARGSKELVDPCCPIAGVLRSQLEAIREVPSVVTKTQANLRIHHVVPPTHSIASVGIP